MSISCQIAQNLIDWANYGLILSVMTDENTIFATAINLMAIKL